MNQRQDMVILGQGTHAEWLLNQMSHKQREKYIDSVDNNLERWLFQCPPRYSMVKRENTMWGELTNNPQMPGFSDEIRRVTELHAEEKQAHIGMLHMLYKVLTRLHGITVKHDAGALVRDSKVLSRRLLLTEQIEARLAEIKHRDRVEVGRKFIGQSRWNNPNDPPYTISKVDVLHEAHRKDFDTYANVYWSLNDGKEDNHRSLPFFRRQIAERNWIFVD